MPEPIANPTKRLERRRRRVLASLPLSAIAWMAIAGLPTAPAAPTPGTMHTEIITLSGPQADPAVGAAARSAASTTAGPGWSTTLDVEDGTQSVAASWVGAPDGERWEVYTVLADSDTFGEAPALAPEGSDLGLTQAPQGSVCCTPASSCC